MAPGLPRAAPCVVASAYLNRRRLALGRRVGARRLCGKRKITTGVTEKYGLVDEKVRSARRPLEALNAEPLRQPYFFGNPSVLSSTPRRNLPLSRMSTSFLSFPDDKEGAR
jgi:hypothetical protein